jgi:D-3-phosphoglycerate dehydrogenase / 2-oxoglutarate reductase
MPKVLISDAMDVIAEKILLDNNIEVDVKTDLTLDELIEKIPTYDGLIVRSATKVTKEIIEKATNLKLIGRAGAGVDNIDLASANENNIIVMNTPGANTNATAEHTLALLLSLSRKIPNANETTHKGEWAKKKLKGNEIKGKTVGIIGFGNVGKRFAEMCIALGLKVIILSKSFESVKNDYPNYDSANLNQLLESADIISFHCKPSFDGSPIISIKEIIKMKKNAIIINTARGNLVSEADLSKAIKNETIKGAAIDVFADEPAIDNSLFGLDNVILTPHIAASTSEAQIVVAEMVANQFVDYFLRDKVSNTVT